MEKKKLSKKDFCYSDSSQDTSRFDFSQFLCLFFGSPNNGVRELEIKLSSNPHHKIFSSLSDDTMTDSTQPTQPLSPARSGHRSQQL
jgi:hypothetical protein